MRKGNYRTSWIAGVLCVVVVHAVQSRPPTFTSSACATPDAEQQQLGNVAHPQNNTLLARRGGAHTRAVSQNSPVTERGRVKEEGREIGIAPLLFFRECCCDLW